MSNARNLEVELLPSEAAQRTDRHFRKTASTWGMIETDFGPIGYESSLEQGFLLMMLADPQTVNIEHQPVRINFKVTGQARKRHYTPDYLVDRDRSKPWVWGNWRNDFADKLLAEVKPSRKLPHTDQSALQRHRAGQKWAEGEGAVFRVVTERFITPISVNNSRSVIAAIDTPFPSWIVKEPILARPMPILEVFDACTLGVDKRMLPHFLYLGCAKGWFWCPLSIRLSLTTIVYPHQLENRTN